MNKCVLGLRTGGTDEQQDCVVFTKFMKGGEKAFSKALGKPIQKKGSLTTYTSEDGGVVTEFTLKDGSKHVYTDYGDVSRVADTLHHAKYETDGTLILKKDVELPG